MEFVARKEGSAALNIPEISSTLGGAVAPAVCFLQGEQLTDRKLWKKFVNQFRLQPDAETLAWRGEYWGKMMRGGVSVYHLTKNEELYDALKETVLDMLSVAEDDGRVSTYKREGEFQGWDLWCRKYVLLGMLYFYDICKSESLKKKIIKFSIGHADYIEARFGEGKRDITTASSSWFGVNSSSILEPYVWLYRVTGEKRYLDFATYIVERGGAEGVNIFDLAYKNERLPYQYGVSKAYEMISCFEGLLAYYCVTGIEKYKVAAINFGLAILESEESVIGSLGCTHELLDHTKYTQTAHRGEREQETCVTVTWMKYCASLYRLTKDSRFADAIEKSFYNAYLGSVNYKKSESDWMWIKFKGTPMYDKVVSSFMPYDSYSPLTPGRRGIGVGGNQLLEDGSYYGCCACIGSVGVGIYASHRILTQGNDITLSFFDDGEDLVKLKGGEAKITVSGGYPSAGRVTVKLSYDGVTDGSFGIRIPAWSKNTEINADIPYTVCGGFAIFKPSFKGESIITLNFDMSLRESFPEPWLEDTVYTDMTGSAGGWHFARAKKIYHSPEFDDYVCLARGPITLAADSALGKAADSKFSFLKKGGNIEHSIIPSDKEIIRLEFTDDNGENFLLTDYASAGKDWKSLIAAWLPTK